MDKLPFGEAFFARLPKVHMTETALKHFNRQNELKGAARLVIAQDGPLSKVKHEFASNGGPRLRWVQGASDSIGMPPSRSLTATRRELLSGEEQKMVKRSNHRDWTVYDANFELCLQQQGIFRESTRFPDGTQIPEPRNLPEINKILSERRNYLQPPGLDEADFISFANDNNFPHRLEPMRAIIPTIIGPKTDEQVSEKRFHIEPIGDIPFIHPAPDIFDCARRYDLHGDIYRGLYRRVIPARVYAGKSDPAVPNWFLEARVYASNMEECKRRICFVSAYGARAMHALQNYGRRAEEKVYDGNAYTFSVVYVAESRCLEVFAHHMARAANGQEQYFMTKLCEFNMVESKDTFEKGIIAVRNVRDLARKYRGEVIKFANDRAVKLRSDTDARCAGRVPSRKGEASSCPEAALQRLGAMLKRTRLDDAVQKDKEAPAAKRRNANNDEHYLVLKLRELHCE
ncbi:hypothetical protein BB8028_0005g01110 [Beauveria bassiana]|uniref:Uncharacterized protein n=1 Tax=Beauveria bassiana TaxID=176275 RepID=A0A2S7YEG5_BEABA|nr:hypothetical protein BB8028_0005g01110 [Beauveria bassiana]